MSTTDQLVCLPISYLTLLGHLKLEDFGLQNSKMPHHTAHLLLFLYHCKYQSLESKVGKPNI
ncbi:hypothetical protein [Zobellia uliginosa]|uniref:hypothetical protein n=1 Tax=Zobellia uliginosa TaxID=143224 RepID=UPI001C07EE4B|nr:hypothetical protein [Zobellia uliginosa]MBU2948159.1 hypothetical protein [Zobellia uliginosa]